LGRFGAGTDEEDGDGRDSGESPPWRACGRGGAGRAERIHRRRRRARGAGASCVVRREGADGFRVNVFFANSL
jgi:hypothetical protein